MLKSNVVIYKSIYQPEVIYTILNTFRLWKKAHRRIFYPHSIINVIGTFITRVHEKASRLKSEWGKLTYVYLSLSGAETTLPVGEIITGFVLSNKQFRNTEIVIALVISTTLETLAKHVFKRHN